MIKLNEEQTECLFAAAMFYKMDLQKKLQDNPRDRIIQNILEILAKVLNEIARQINKDVESKLLFRFHRGGYNESMDTVVEIESKDHLELLACKAWHSWGLKFISLEIKPHVFDERNQWDTHLVLASFGERTVPVGYLNKNPDWNNNNDQA
jgi:hypothetical protein